MIDWRARRDEIYDELVPLFTEEEKALLPLRHEVPDSASATIARLRRALSTSDRALLHTESFGDFSFLFLVPRQHEEAFVACVGPWLIRENPDA
jgi:hypothetical protein